MLFVELRFFFFAALVFAVYWLLRSNQWRKLWLLAASYLFYGAWDWRFLGLIAFSTGLDYALARQIEQAGSPRVRRALVTASVIVNLGVLGLFKYFNFFLASAIDVLRLLGLPAEPNSLAIVLPVGISFYTFQSLGYCVDVYRRQLPAANSLLDFALYVAFFPQLVAGPIVRAGDFLPQLDSARRFNEIRLQPALALFLIGFCKKACVSDNLSPYVDLYFASPGDFDAASAWLAVWLYAVQIYCDFSGYSDMGVASAAMLGYRLCENFRQPYFAAGIGDFWRRWHISLSTWLRDYVYIPLGGNRRGRWRTCGNLFATMTLGGLWHGAAWTFVLWGALHGAALVAERLWSELVGAAPTGRSTVWSSSRRAIGWALALYWIGATWILFRSPDLHSAGLTLESYVGFVSHGAMSLPGVLWLHIACLAAIHYLLTHIDLVSLSARLPEPAFAALYGGSFAVCLACLPIGYRPFIYFQF